MNKVLEILKSQLPKNEAWWNTPEQVDESEKYLIDSLKYLDKLCEKASYICDKPLDNEECFDYMESIDPDFKGDNTYNWNASIDRELDIRFARKGDSMWIAFKIHRGGDVRCNYTDWILMRFDNEYDYYDAEYELDNSFDIVVDNKTYTITPRLTEYYDCYCDDSGDSTELYIDDLTDEACIKAIKDWQGDIK